MAEMTSIGFAHVCSMFFRALIKGIEWNQIGRLFFASGLK